MYCKKTKLEDVFIIEPKRFEDDRGWFSETWNQNHLDAVFKGIRFVQDNHSLSIPKHTVRGLHFQSPPAAQDKLIRVLSGSITDVVVDIRNGSPTYGEWFSILLSKVNGKQLLIPKGFLHGFITLEDNTEILYKCSDFYSPIHEAGIKYNDPDLNVNWGINSSNITLSQKDKNLTLFKDFKSPFIFENKI
ncbi:dTDP-4-dehydrorhamnose 3,5-epimerase [Amylibacter sp.]|nr:dTDP-4-dehydrorhamnose 3,5-epimerase [Amylibacter sp.]